MKEIKSCKKCPFKHTVNNNNFLEWHCNIDGHYVHHHYSNDVKSPYCELNEIL
ncbi:MAG: hypothetical protein ACOCUI_00355 [bacterium]